MQSVMLPQNILHALSTVWLYKPKFALHLTPIGELINCEIFSWSSKPMQSWHPQGAVSRTCTLVTTLPQRIPSFNSSWTHDLAEFVCCSWFLSWKKEGRPDLPILIWSCHPTLSHLSPRGLQELSLCNQPETTWPCPLGWTVSLGLGMI